MKNKDIKDPVKKPVIFTIGHSTHPIDEFMELLKAHAIQEVADVRTIPKSRHNPQFNEDDLKKSLRTAHVRYKHIKRLGGLRHTTKDSINLGWHNTSFRGYADYMATPEFEEGLETLLKIASTKNTIIMCAEAVPWRCHRSLIADALTKKGWLVRDIMSHTSAVKHRLTPFLKVRKGQLIYPAPKT
ncbi:MAG: DUF488 domain-containing protein [Candidatus Moraniibacteriota bacterium]